MFGEEGEDPSYGTGDGKGIGVKKNITFRKENLAERGLSDQAQSAGGDKEKKKEGSRGSEGRMSRAAQYKGGRGKTS